MPCMTVSTGVTSCGRHGSACGRIAGPPGWIASPWRSCRRSTGWPGSWLSFSMTCARARTVPRQPGAWRYRSQMAASRRSAFRRSATEMGRNRVHELNREHVAAPVAEALAGLRLVLWKRFRSTLGSWNPKPVYACVFGSAARGDGDVHSDIDLLLVRAPVAGETDLRRASGGLAGVVAGYPSEFIAVQLTTRQAAKWSHQVGQLHDLVPAWSGNPLQVLEMSTFEWADHRRRRTPLFTEIDRDAIQVAGETSLMSARTGPA
jgi:Nucleotidyltransferase domain